MTDWLWLWSIGVVDLGLSMEVFRSLTPKMFFALTERWGDEQKRQDARAGLVAAMVLNAQRQKSTAKVWSAADFFPSLKAAPKSQTPEEMLAVVEALNAAFGGEDTRPKEEPNVDPG